MFSDNALLTSEKWSIFKTTRRKEQFLGSLAMLAVNKEEMYIGAILKKSSSAKIDQLDALCFINSLPYYLPKNTSTEQKIKLLSKIYNKVQLPQILLKLLVGFSL